MKLNKVSLGLALGVFRAISVLLFGILSMTTSYLDNIVIGIGTIYPGYEATVVGILIGIVWAFVDGFVCGFIIARLYNLFAKNK